MSMKTTEFLKLKVGLFKDFSDDRLRQLVNGSRVASFEANEAVAHCGEEAAHFSVVLGGAVSASMIGEGGTRQVLGRLEAGGTFGELALMTGDTLLADFIAESPCEVLRIPVSLFQSIIMAEPKAVQHMSRTIAKRLQEVMSDPSKAAAALRKGDDPYGLKLKGERPEKILVINCGSSSVKYRFYDTANESRQACGPGGANWDYGNAAGASRAGGRGKTRASVRRIRRSIRRDSEGTQCQRDGRDRLGGRS